MVAAAKQADAVWYPETDEMGEHALQRFIAELLRGVLVRWFRAQGRVAFAGANQFVYWREGDPHASRAPDVYVLEGVPQDAPEVGSWKTWEGHAPSFALEVCSADNWQKDYDDAPADYDAMGVRELVIFDPGATARSRRRVRWQLYRRVRGVLKSVASARGDRVWSQVLGCFVRLVDQDGHPRLRLATGPNGGLLLPTAEEAEQAALALVHAERAAKEAALAAEAAERVAKEAARAEVERLRRALAEALGAAPPVGTRSEGTG
ncbi:MAG: Uma2 family endonuclease [Deltaproteobacteria bacterium]|nr:Uma2 family endonuclease [Deltaproteobacteria bacterium]